MTITRVYRCQHCGNVGPAGEDHSCPCPFSDDACPDHPSIEQRFERVMALLNVPDQEDFLRAAVTEAQYQRTRWTASDEAKTDSDWFWLAGYLLGKALHDVRGKRVHHLTAAAAAIANWHAQAIARGEHMPQDRGDQKDHAGRVVTEEGS